MAADTKPNRPEAMSLHRDSFVLRWLPLMPPPGVRANAEKGEQLRMCRMSG